VREKLFDVDPFVLENHSNNQPISVTANIENREITHHVGRGKRLADILKAFPVRVNRRIEPYLQRRSGVSEFGRFFQETTFADDVQS
jgi:hypothetical protein